MSGLNPMSGQQTQTYDERDLPERLIRYVLGGLLFMLGEPDRNELVGYFLFLEDHRDTLGTDRGGIAVYFNCHCK
jgi:hypothetical protein